MSQNSPQRHFKARGVPISGFRLIGTQNPDLWPKRAYRAEFESRKGCLMAIEQEGYRQEYTIIEAENGWTAQCIHTKTITVAKSFGELCELLSSKIDAAKQ